MKCSETKNVLAYLPTGFVSRSKACRQFGLRKKVYLYQHQEYCMTKLYKDFESETVKNAAVVVTVRGQTGIFFEEAVIKSV